MATGRGKEKKELVNREAESKAAIAEWKPTELETLQSKNTLDFLKDWGSGKDVKDMQGLAGFYDLVGGGEKRQAQDRIGGGLFNASGSNTSGLATMLKAQIGARDQQDRTNQLYNAGKEAHQYASGVLAPNLMGMAENRFAGRAGMFNSRESDYRGFANRPSAAGGIVKSLIGGATGVISGGLVPGGFLR